MGFLSHRRTNVEIRPEAKWDYIVSIADTARGFARKMADPFYNSN